MLWRKPIVISYALYITNYGVQSLCGLIVARIYLSEAYGQYSYFMGLSVLFATMAQFGTSQSFIALAGQRVDVKRLIIPFYMVRVAGFASVTVLAAIVFLLFAPHPLAYISLLLVLPLSVNAHPIFDYYGMTMEDVKINVLYDTLLFLIIFIFLVPFKARIEHIVLAKALTRLFAEVVKYVQIRVKIGIKGYSKRYFKWYLSRSKMFFVSRLILEAYARSEILLLGLFAPKAELGVYSAAQAFVEAAIFFNALLARVLFARLSQASSNYRKCRAVLLQSIRLNALFLLPIVLATWGFGSHFIYTYLLPDPSYHRSAVMLDILIVALVPAIFVNNTNLLLFSSKKSDYVSVHLIGLILNILIACPGYWLFSIEGYAVAIQAGRIICILCSLCMSKRQLTSLKHEVMPSGL